MKEKVISMKSLQILLLALCVAILSFTSAHADLLGLYARGKIDYIGGTGDVFKKFNPAPSTGVEAGIELLGLTIFADGYWMGQDQFLASGNLGFDFAFGEDIEFKLGIYGTGTFFKFPEQSVKPISFSSQEQAQFSSLGVNISDFQNQYQTIASQEAVASSMSFGLGAKSRLSIAYKVLPILSIGLQGTFGYHLILSGEDAAADLKARTISAYVAKNGLPSAIEKQLKEKLGAKEVDTTQLQGTNYAAGAFVEIRF
jgi:hypothetical protein